MLSESQPLTEDDFVRQLRLVTHTRCPVSCPAHSTWLDIPLVAKRTRIRVRASACQSHQPSCWLLVLHVVCQVVRRHVTSMTWRMAKWRNIPKIGTQLDTTITLSLCVLTTKRSTRSMRLTVCNYHWQLTCDHHTFGRWQTINVRPSHSTHSYSTTRVRPSRIWWHWDNVVTNNVQPAITHYLSGDTDWDKCDHHISCYWQRANHHRDTSVWFLFQSVAYVASIQQPGRVGVRSGGGLSTFLAEARTDLKHPVLSEWTVLFCKWFQAMTFLVSVKVWPSHVWRLTKPRDHHTSGDSVTKHDHHTSGDWQSATITHMATDKARPSHIWRLTKRDHEWMNEWKFIYSA